MNNQTIFRPQMLTTRLLTTAVVAILALIGGFALANGPAARAAMEKVGLLQAVPAIPETFNYQGFLREADGSPTTGVKNIASNIYAAPTDGTSLNTENFANVNVRDGLFNIVIGDATPLGTTFDTAPLYIGISVDGTELIPRERIHGVPWAIRATSAGYAASAGFANSANAANFAITADSATTATKANTVASGAIKIAIYTSAKNGAVKSTGFDTPVSLTHACFLTTSTSDSNSNGGGNTGDRSDCRIRGGNLEAGNDSYCEATCLDWSE